MTFDEQDTTCQDLSQYQIGCFQEMYKFANHKCCTCSWEKKNFFALII